jgi:hypothetical protein
MDVLQLLDHGFVAVTEHSVVLQAAHLYLQQIRLFCQTSHVRLMQGMQVQAARKVPHQIPHQIPEVVRWLAETHSESAMLRRRADTKFTPDPVTWIHERRRIHILLKLRTTGTHELEGPNDSAVSKH